MTPTLCRQYLLCNKQTYGAFSRTIHQKMSLLETFKEPLEKDRYEADDLELSLVLIQSRDTIREYSIHAVHL